MPQEFALKWEPSALDLIQQVDKSTPETAMAAPPQDNMDIDRCFYNVELSDTRPPATPLVLIHDSGGTVVSYYKLGPLGRSVYAISNPTFNRENKWDGGLLAMARAYVQAIKKHIPHGDILLGGTIVSLFPQQQATCRYSGGLPISRLVFWWPCGVGDVSHPR